MSPFELRSACEQAGGVAALARLLGKRPRYLFRRLNGEYPISRMDALAVQKALEAVVESGT